MGLEQLSEFTRIILVFASQMAYVEGAQNTHSILHKLIELFRYFTKNDSKTIISKELKALEAYMELQSFRYENKFSYTINNSLSDIEVPVERLIILNFVDTIMSDALEQYEGTFEIVFALSKGTTLCFTACIKSFSDENIYSLHLKEENA